MANNTDSTSVVAALDKIRDALEGTSVATGPTSGAKGAKPEPKPSGNVVEALDNISAAVVKFRNALTPPPHSPAPPPNRLAPPPNSPAAVAIPRPAKARPRQ